MLARSAAIIVASLAATQAEVGVERSDARDHPAA